MADSKFNFGQALNTAGQIGGGLLGVGSALASAYFNTPKAASNKAYKKRASMVGNTNYGISDMSGLMSQIENTSTLHNIAGRDLYNPSEEEMFSSLFGAGMGAYGAMAGVTSQFKQPNAVVASQGGTPSTMGNPVEDTTTSEAIQNAATREEQFDEAEKVAKGVDADVLRNLQPVASPQVPIQVPQSTGWSTNADPTMGGWYFGGYYPAIARACGGHLHKCGGHKYANGGFNWGNFGLEAANLTMGGLGVALNYLGMRNQIDKAAMEADEVNAANAYARQMLSHNQNQAINDTKNNMARMQALQMMAMGGDLQTHGADFPLTGNYNVIGAGGTHEQNPFGGVYQGMAADGLPNLVEEDEVVWNDYVFSNRINVPKQFLDAHKLGKGGDLTYAETAQKLAKEASERPNDPISQNGLADALGSLMESQEEVKARREAAKVKRAISKMTPTEVMQMLGALQGAQQSQPYMPTIPQTQFGYADGGMLGAHTFAGDKGSSKMTRKEKAAAEEAAREQAKLRRRIEALTESMSLQELQDYAATLAGYDANNYQDTNSIEALREFVRSRGNADAFRRYIADKQNLRLYQGDVPYNMNTTYDNTSLMDLINQRYTASKTPGVGQGTYAIDKAMKPSAKERQAMKEYQDFTDYVIKQIENMQQGKSYNKDFLEKYIDFLDNGVPETADVPQLGVRGEDRVITRDANGNIVLADNAVDTYRRLRTDDKEGIYHLYSALPTETSTGSRKVYRKKDSKGNLVTVDVTDEDVQNNPYVKVGKTETVTDENGRTTTYIDLEDKSYKDADIDEEGNGTQDEIAPLYQTISRYAPVVGNLAGLIAATAPAKDYSTAFAPRRATFEPIGDYLPYMPVDTQRYINAENQQAAAQLNAIMNASAGNKNIAMAQAALANQQRQRGIGDILAAAEQINWGRRAQSGEFNRGTNMFNAQGFNASEQANLQNNPLLLRQAQQNAMMKYRTDAERDAAISANAEALIDSLAGIGQENFYFNQANANKALDYLTGRSGLSWYGRKACGGRLTKK